MKDGSISVWCKQRTAGILPAKNSFLHHTEMRRILVGYEVTQRTRQALLDELRERITKNIELNIQVRAPGPNPSDLQRSVGVPPASSQNRARSAPPNHSGRSDRSTPTAFRISKIPLGPWASRPHIPPNFLIPFLLRVSTSLRAKHPAPFHPSTFIIHPFPAPLRKIADWSTLEVLPSAYVSQRLGTAHWPLWLAHR